MKPNTILYILLLATILLVSFVLFRRNFGYATQISPRVSQFPTPSPHEYPKLTVGNTTITVEIVTERGDIARGLGGRESLKGNHGMLFDLGYENTYPRFWMKDMLISLDFIWIDDGKVVDITEKVEPPSPGTSDSDLLIYSPKKPVDLILEVNSGFVEKHGILIGDEVTVN